MSMNRAERAALEREQMEKEMSTMPPPMQPASKTGASTPGNPVSEGVAVRLRDQLDAAREELVEFKKSGRAVLLVSPAVLHSFPYNPRVKESYEDDAFKSLVEAIQRTGGNYEEVKVRQVATLEEGHYEILSGHRRTEACKVLGLNVKVVVVDVTDNEALRLVEQENAEHSPPTQYELGHQYQALLKDKVFADQAALAAEIGASPSTVSRCVAIANIGKLFAPFGVDCRDLSQNALQKIGPWITTKAKSKSSEAEAAKAAAAKELFDKASKLKEGDVTVASLVAATKAQVKAPEIKEGKAYTMKSSGKRMVVDKVRKDLTVLRIPSGVSDEILARIAEML